MTQKRPLSWYMMPGNWVAKAEEIQQTYFNHDPAEDHTLVFKWDGHGVDPKAREVNQYKKETKVTYRQGRGLVVSGHVLDNETGTGDPVPKYEFFEMFPESTKNRPTTWHSLIKSMNIKVKNEDFVPYFPPKPVFRKVIDNPNCLIVLSVRTVKHYKNPWLVMEGFRMKPTSDDEKNVNNFSFSIGIDLRSASQRSKVLKAYQARDQRNLR